MIFGQYSFFTRFFSAGFYYKTFIQPRFAWKYIYEPIIRLGAGLGKAPREKDPDSYEHFYVHVNTLVVGGGLSGLETAQLLGSNGEEVLLLEQAPFLGGRFLVDGNDIDGIKPNDWIEEVKQKISKYSNLKIKLNTVVAGIYDHGYVIANENILTYEEGGQVPKERLWRIRAKR